MAVKQEQVLNTLRALKTIDESNLEELGEILANISIIKSELETQEKAVKARLLEKGISPDPLYYSELGKKVYLTDGQKKTVYDVPSIGRAFERAGMLESFYDIVSIVQNKVVVEDEATGQKVNVLPSAGQEILEQYSETENGTPSVTCRALSKEDKANLAQAR